MSTVKMALSARKFATFDLPGMGTVEVDDDVEPFVLVLALALLQLDQLLLVSQG